MGYPAPGQADNLALEAIIPENPGCVGRVAKGADGGIVQRMVEHRPIGCLAQGWRVIPAAAKRRAGIHLSAPPWTPGRATLARGDGGNLNPASTPASP